MSVRSRRRRIWSWCNAHAGQIALVIACLGIAGGISAVRAEADQRASVDRARSEQIEWDRAASDHDACERQARGREEGRRTWFGIFDTLDRYAAPENQAEVRKVTDDLREGVRKNLPPIDCAKVAPEPEGPRPTIP